MNCGGIHQHRAVDETDVREPEVPERRNPFLAGDRRFVLKAAGERVDPEESADDTRDIQSPARDVLDEGAAADARLDVDGKSLRADEPAFSMRTLRMPPEVSLPMPMQAKIESASVQFEMCTSSCRAQQRVGLRCRGPI